MIYSLKVLNLQPSALILDVYHQGEIHLLGALMNKEIFSQDITRTTLAVLFIAILIAACFWVMKPFLFALIWATMIVIATWPMMLSIQSRLGGRRWLAVLIMTFLLLAILIVPLTLAIITVIDKAQELLANSQALTSLKIPSPPEWLQKIPLTGEKIAAKWQELSLLTPLELSAQFSPYSKKIVGWFLTQAGSIGMLIVHCFLTVIISAVMYANGETAASGIRRFFTRIAGQSGDNAAILAARSIRGVAIGIIGTALAQTILGSLGLLLTGVPGLFILAAVMLLLSVAQVGPALVLIPAAIWLFMQEQAGWGIFMIVWLLFVGTIDNFIRPILIKRGADLPLLLIFAGVIGGLLSFGIIGLFIGPVTLAVTYTLLKEWIAAGEIDQKEELITDLNTNEGVKS